MVAGVFCWIYTWHVFFYLVKIIFATSVYNSIPSTNDRILKIKLSENINYLFVLVSSLFVCHHNTFRGFTWQKYEFVTSIETGFAFNFQTLLIAVKSSKTLRVIFYIVLLTLSLKNLYKECIIIFKTYENY